MTAPVERSLAVLGLGGTVAGSVEARVVVAHSFDELTDAARGAIVLWNVPMLEEERMVHGYGEAVKYRVQGASRAAEKGAVASLVRSVTTRSLYTPHTGMLRYEDDVEQIPSAAVTVEDADLIDRLTPRWHRGPSRADALRSDGPRCVEPQRRGRGEGIDAPGRDRPARCAPRQLGRGSRAPTTTVRESSR
jgi:hypothetical protein